MLGLLSLNLARPARDLPSPLEQVTHAVLPRAHSTTLRTERGRTTPYHLACMLLRAASTFGRRPEMNGIPSSSH